MSTQRPRPLRPVVLFLLFLGLWIQTAQATLFVSTSGQDEANDCQNEASPCATLQKAVDLAEAAEEIRVAAGTYSGSIVVWVTRFEVEHHYKQVVFINKSLTLRGGFTEANWLEPDPLNNVTTIDALGDGRPVSIVDTEEQMVVLDGFTLTGGDYTGLGNPQGESNFVCAFSGEDCGGGLFVYQSAFHLRNSVVSGNVGNTGQHRNHGAGRRHIRPPCHGQRDSRTGPRVHTGQPGLGPGQGTVPGLCRRIDAACADRECSV